MANIDVIMPQMGESITEGTVVKWLKKEGDRVERDEPLFEISTEKCSRLRITVFYCPTLFSPLIRSILSENRQTISEIGTMFLGRDFYHLDEMKGHISLFSTD